MNKNDRQKAQKLFEKAIAFGQQGAPEKEKAAYDDLVNKALMQGRLGRLEEAGHTYEKLIERFKDTDAPAIKELVDRARMNKQLSYHF